MDKRLAQQMQFILEMDKLKSIFRQSYLIGTTRKENDAEHSWHLAMMVLVLGEHANGKIDALKVLKMVLIHDIVEIDAGDTFCYDEKAAMDKSEREQLAAKRIFGLLPDDQRDEFEAIWQEFEAAKTVDAKFARSVDRLMPMLHNYHTQGQSWQEHGVIKEQVVSRNHVIDEGSNALWKVASDLIDNAVNEGYL
ncbi:MAG: HD domain-containing protein [Thiotrichaceae bacterium]|nr:HD domain-containing protein [Thiotrichaceae bacterium]